jgi:hypothetical protein
VITIPTSEEVQAKSPANMTALEMFIFHHLPINCRISPRWDREPDEEEMFRERLLNALLEVREQTLLTRINIAGFKVSSVAVCIPPITVTYEEL